MTQPDGPLLRHLKRRLALEGPIPISEFMALALGHPQHGYYMTRDPLGAAGDFTTAPEISQMFGELIGLWCAEVWRLIGEPARVRLVELGPGRGTLMADMLRAARMAPGFRQALRVTLVETSPALRAAQDRTLTQETIPVDWAESVDALPDEGAPLLIVANEFFDALPIRQFQKTAAGWRERLVALEPETGALALTLAPAPGPAAALIPERAAERADAGAIVEIAPAAWSVAAALGERLTACGGAALIVDYGHGASAPGDTLQAVKAHRYCGVLEHVGEADLTAHVDFDALARAFSEAGCRPAPLATQGGFLQALGIVQRAATLARKGDPAAVRAQAERLVAPDQMGTLFKVLGAAAPATAPLPALEG
ncbi:MAG: class I SAM-dependent methyltransferase [Marivibrio sp.]|uniref:class I SAM-dependent methyltransferase n=1 Tax=Marivibrio sp. TaxID=2039719 RepID=UPI0032ECC679